MSNRAAWPGPSPTRPDKLRARPCSPAGCAGGPGTGPRALFVPGGPVGPGKFVGLGRPIARSSEEEGGGGMAGRARLVPGKTAGGRLATSGPSESESRVDGRRHPRRPLSLHRWTGQDGGGGGSAAVLRFKAEKEKGRVQAAK
jgi:hypothetical protein